MSDCLLPPSTVVAVSSEFVVLSRLNELCRELQHQFELDCGRGQIQYLASLFHPDGPNDVAPGGYNETDPPAGLPDSPLPVAVSATGFRWG